MLRWILSLLLIANIAAAQSFPKDGKLYAQGFGSNTFSTLNVLLTRIGSADATVVCGAGSWAITDNLTFPANVRVEVPFGSGFNISSGKVLTVNGGFEAGVYPVFSGLGTAAGSAEFLYRYTQWGDTNQYNIGQGQIEVANSSISNILNTSADAGQESLTNALLIQATNGEFDNLLGDLSFSGTALFPSNDMAVGFMGYPKLTLTTNMVTVSSSGGNPFTADSFTNIFDGDLKTRVTADAPTAGILHKYIIDLGQSYVGYVATSHGSTNSSGASVLSTYKLLAHETLYDGYLTKDNGSVYLQGSDGSYINSMWLNSSQSGAVTNMLTAPFQGRYIAFSIVSDSGVPDYFMSDLSVWAQPSTNAWRNMGESQ